MQRAAHVMAWVYSYEKLSRARDAVTAVRSCPVHARAYPVRQDKTSSDERRTVRVKVYASLLVLQNKCIAHAVCVSRPSRARALLSSCRHWLWQDWTRVVNEGWWWVKTN